MSVAHTDIWLASLSESSRPRYQQALEEFCAFHGLKPEIDVATAIVDYVGQLREDGYATSTLWSIVSILKSYLMILEKKDLFVVAPRLKSLLKQWSKQDEIKKSAVRSHFA